MRIYTDERSQSQTFEVQGQADAAAAVVLLESKPDSITETCSFGETKFTLYCGYDCRICGNALIADASSQIASLGDNQLVVSCVDISFMIALLS